MIRLRSDPHPDGTVRVGVFAGPDGPSLALVGDLTLNATDFESLKERVAMPEKHKRTLSRRLVHLVERIEKRRAEGVEDDKLFHDLNERDALQWAVGL